MSDTAQAKQAFDWQAEEAQLSERCAQLVELARAAGADEAEAFGQRAEEIAVRFEKSDLKITQADEGTSIGLRVFKDKKLGFSSTNQTDDASLQGVARDALTLANFSLADEANVLPVARELDERPTLVTPDLTTYGIDDAVAHGKQFVDRLSSVDPRISLDQCELGLHRVSVAVNSTAGAAFTESDASLGMQAFGMAIDGDDVGGFDYWGDSVRHLALLEGAMQDTVTRFTEAVIGNLAAGAAETYRGPVLFSPAAFLEIFISPLIGSSSSIAVQRGRSFLAGKLGEEIAAPCLSILDDPTDLRLGGAARFDREGQPARPFSLVEHGVLKGYLYNGYSAQVEGCASTGHAAGGARSVPGLATHGLCLAPGDGGTPAAMRATLGRGLLCQRFSGTVDAASGDFSGVAKSARWIENGEVVRSLKETLISGNAFELLGAMTLGSESEVLNGSRRAPWALIDGVSVTAG